MNLKHCEKKTHLLAPSWKLQRFPRKVPQIDCALRCSLKCSILKSQSLQQNWVEQVTRDCHTDETHLLKNKKTKIATHSQFSKLNQEVGHDFFYSSNL